MKKQSRKRGCSSPTTGKLSPSPKLKRRRILSPTIVKPSLALLSEALEESLVSTGKQSQKRKFHNILLIAHDGIMFEFKIDNSDKVVAGSVKVVYVPKTADHTFERRCDNLNADHLDIKSNPSTSKFGRRSYDLVFGREGKYTDFNHADFVGSFGDSASSSIEVLPDINVHAFEQEIVIKRKEFRYEGLNDSWLLRFSKCKLKVEHVCDRQLNFNNVLLKVRSKHRVLHLKAIANGRELELKRKRVARDLVIEYAPTADEFFAVWTRHGLSLGMENSTKLSQGIPIEGGEKSHTQLFDGMFNGIPVILKQVKAREAPSSFFLSMKCQWLANTHINLVRLHDTGYDDREEGGLFNITMEKCSYTLEQMLDHHRKFGGISTGVWKSLFRELFQAINYLHEQNIVHGSIRPQNILVLEYTGSQYVAKLGGMGRCRHVPKRREECSKNGNLEEYGKDFYDYGRIILRCMGGGQHIIKDDDPECDMYFETNERFKAEMRLLKKIDGVAHDFVSMLLKGRFNGKKLKKVARHAFFWHPGEILNYLMKVSDYISDDGGDAQMKAALDKKSTLIFGKEWRSKVSSRWYKAMSKGKRFKGKKVRTMFPYPATTVSSLMRIVRNTVHHPSSLKKAAWKDIGRTLVGFERYITRRFPCLFIEVHKVVKSKFPGVTFLNRNH